jgi:anaerobic selenocysteine-containing dehydrogenase
MSTSGSTTTCYRACNLCEAVCGLEIQVADGAVVSIKGDAEDPFSRGYLCPKAVALQDIQSDTDRLRGPVRRSASGWEPISWKEAFELCAARLSEIRAKHGNDAIATYQGNPSVHNYGLMTHSGGFLGLLKTRNRFSATSVDQLPHQLVVYWMFGHQLLVPIPDIDHTEYFLMLGANPLASNGSLMTVPDVPNRLKALRRRGGKLVVIDPRRTETAEAADEHHFIRPGSDAALLIGILSTIFEEGLARPGRLSAMLDGFEEVKSALLAFNSNGSSSSAERASSVTGIPAATIRRLAREFAAAERAVCYGRLGVSTQAHGALCQWLIQLINIATGNLDREGGSLVTRPALDLIGAPGSKPGSFNRWKSRVSGKTEVLGELPVAALAEEILTPGEGQVRALVTIAGNPVLSTPNGTKLDEALAKLDFMVSIDLYINETTRHADLILPSTAPLEHDHYDMVFNMFAVRNTAKYSPAALPRPEGALHDWEIMNRLAEALASKTGQTARPSIDPEQMLDFGLQMGPYGMATPHQLSLEKLKAAAHGVDLGPLSPSFPDRLAHADKRIHCAPEPLMAALSELDRTLFAPAQSGELLLIGRRHLRSNNSWMHNYRRLVKGKSRHQLFMHPEDADRLGLGDGQRVRVRSRTGTVDVEMMRTDSIMPGVVSLPHGWGHGRAGVRLSIAQEHAGVSANDLTDDEFLDRVSGNAALNGVPVSVEAIHE